MKVQFFEELKRFVGFTDEDSRHLEKLLDWLQPRLDGMTDVFYATILRHPEARQVFRDDAQVERLKTTLRSWAVKLCSGPHDEAYLGLRARIGRIHVQIGLPQRYMLTGMNIIRQYFLALIQEKASSPAEERQVTLAVEKILDCELAIMLETYHQDLLGKLRRQERLAAIGTVAVAIHHELKNPLGVLRTSVDSLRRTLGERVGHEVPDRVQRHLEKIDRNLGKMQKNITSLLEFGRDKPPALVECDIRALIDEALDEAAAPPGVETVKRHAPSLPAVHVDPTQIGRVFVNLARNAFEIMKGEGMLVVETAVLPGGIRISFHDTGPGVPADVREQIFEPLWTNRPGGTGMGLAICRNLVEAHRGKIWVESEGRGAHFHVELPLRGETV